MKKIIAMAVLCAAVSSAFLTGCKEKKQVEEEYTGNVEKFIIGLDDAFPPMGFRDENNEIVGFDIDLAEEVANRLGYDFVAQPIDWDSKEQELNTGKISCIWNGLTITPERLEALTFSDPYLENAQVVVVRADSGYKTLGDLAGKKIGLQAGSSAADALDASAEFKASLGSVVEFKENITALNDLEMGGVDGVVMDSVVANYSITTTEKPFVVISESLAPEKYGIAFKKDNVELRDKVQQALNDMAKDGTAANISKKWFGTDISVIGK